MDRLRPPRSARTDLPSGSSSESEAMRNWAARCKGEELLCCSDGGSLSTFFGYAKANVISLRHGTHNNTLKCWFLGLRVFTHKLSDAVVFQNVTSTSCYICFDLDSGFHPNSTDVLVKAAWTNLRHLHGGSNVRSCRCSPRCLEINSVWACFFRSA